MKDLKFELEQLLKELTNEHLHIVKELSKLLLAKDKSHGTIGQRMGQMEAYEIIITKLEKILTP